MFGRKKRQPVGERTDLAGRALNVLERTRAALADGRMVVPGKARPSFEKELAELHSQLSAAGDEATPTVESVLPAQWLAVRWDAVWCKNTEVAGWYPYFRGGLSGPPVEYVSVQGDDLWRLSPWSEPILLWVMETEGVEHDVEIPPDVVADVRRSLRPLLRPRDPLLGFEAVREARARVLGPKHVAGRNPAMSAREIRRHAGTPAPLVGLMMAAHELRGDRVAAIPYEIALIGDGERLKAQAEITFEGIEGGTRMSMGERNWIHPRAAAVALHTQRLCTCLLWLLHGKGTPDALISTAVGVGRDEAALRAWGVSDYEPTDPKRARGRAKTGSGGSAGWLSILDPALTLRWLAQDHIEFLMPNGVPVQIG